MTLKRRKQTCKRLFHEFTAITGSGNKPIPPEQQVRQKRDQQFEGLDEYDYRLEASTGWRYYPSSTTHSSSSSRWQQPLLFMKVCTVEQVTLAANTGHLSACFCVVRRKRRRLVDLSMRVTVNNPLTASSCWRMARCCNWTSRDTEESCGGSTA